MSHDMLLRNVQSYMCDGVRDWKTKVGRKYICHFDDEKIIELRIK